MARPRTPQPAAPWLRSTDAPIPDTYRLNFVVRDPELVALLVRAVPHGQLTKTLQRLMREGYDRLVATGAIHPADHLRPAELAALQAGHRNALRRKTPDQQRDTTVIPESWHGEEPARPQVRPLPTSPRPTPAAVAPKGLIAEPASPAHSAGMGGGSSGATDVPQINDDDANVLLGAQ